MLIYWCIHPSPSPLTSLPNSKAGCRFFPVFLVLMLSREVKQFYHPFSSTGPLSFFLVFSTTLYWTQFPPANVRCQIVMTSWEGCGESSGRWYQERTLSNPCNGCDLPLKHLINSINHVVILAILANSRFCFILQVRLPWTHQTLPSCCTSSSSGFVSIWAFLVCLEHLAASKPIKTGPPLVPCI